MYEWPLPAEYADTYRADFPDELVEDLGTMLWFGPPWPSERTPVPVCHPDTHIPTPVGERCAWCHERFTEVDAGIRIPHLGPDREYSYFGHHCFLRSVGLPAEEGA